MEPPRERQKPKTVTKLAAESTRPNSQAMARIPSMTALLKAAESFETLRGTPHAVVSEALRKAVAVLRERLQKGGVTEKECGVDAVLSQAREILNARRAHRLRRVINATGVVLHTGLGRSVLPSVAIERIGGVAGGYCSLEIDLETGKRGRRGRHVEELLLELTDAEAAMVVNNNAAATMLALHALARGREVIVSRGQLIEIGGSYRLPEVMIAGGSTLHEVGTTNKTRLRDYEAVIDEQTAMIMHVHTSNYRVVGFSENPGTKELSELARAHGIIMFDDLGSGALLDGEVWSSANEPTVASSLKHGADLVSFSGDKLLGGPQAGILLGRRSIIDRLRNDPMARALRVDKLTVAALEAVLELYHDPDRAMREIPLLARLVESESMLVTRAEKLSDRLSSVLPDDSFMVKSDESFAGGGSLPAWPFPTAVVCWKPAGNVSLDELAQKLRLGDPSVLCRIKEDAIHLDLRTVPEHEYDELIQMMMRGRSSQGH
ncbi:MAG: L-seryl-tRNA(Sec) selenium transferase [Phycisphaerales bacterium]|nr:L-seryl-tRNA(Sec) selenium transferase [Phycisphaerales bacterium]